MRRAVARTFLGRVPPQRGPRDKAHNSITGSSPATQTAEQGTGAVTKGPGWVSGAVGGSQVVLEQGASGRASPDFLCAGPRAARRLSPSIGSLELDALRRPNFWGMNDLASRQIVCFVIDVWRTITKPKRAGLGSVSPRCGTSEFITRERLGVVRTDFTAYQWHARASCPKQLSAQLNS